MMHQIKSIILFDIRHHMMRGGAAIRSVMFFTLCAFLIGFTGGPMITDTGAQSHQIIWIFAILSGLLSLERLFYEDFDDGTLDQLVLTGMPIWALIYAKAIGHWVYTIVPILIITPIIGLFLNMPTAVTPPLMISLLWGTPIFSLLSALSGTLTLGARRGAILGLMIILPFFIPILIFALSYIDAHIAGGNAYAPLMMMAALFIFTAVFVPLAGSLSLRQAIR